jgi:hypothetical protein
MRGRKDATVLRRSQTALRPSRGRSVKSQERCSIVAAVHVQSKGLSLVSVKLRSHPSTPTCLERRWFHSCVRWIRGVEKIRYECRICTILRRRIPQFGTDVTKCKSRESHPYPFRTDKLAYVQALHRLTATIDVHGVPSDDEALDITSLVHRRHLSLIAHLTMKIALILALTVSTASAFSSKSAFTGRGRVSLVTPSALGTFRSVDGTIHLLISSRCCSRTFRLCNAQSETVYAQRACLTAAVDRSSRPFVSPPQLDRGHHRHQHSYA